MQRVLIISFLVLFGSQAIAQKMDSLWVKAHYDKSEHFIKMRDGVKLYTIVYTPKDKQEKYPFLMNRTCYNASNKDGYAIVGQPSEALIRDKYIIVYQDVRGRYMSEGVFDNMRPNIPGNKKKDVDESSDTYDTIDWLIKNIKNNNGKVGQFGISYPGFYTAAALPDAHPALQASSPQAPISDFFFDDFHHHGAYLESYTPAFGVFGYHKDSLTRDSWFGEELMRLFSLPVIDGYDFYLNQGSLKNITETYHHDNFFWKQIIDHPNYDEFWQKRSILPHLSGIDHAVMTVGGWYDAEDLYGPLNIYKNIEKKSPDAKNILVMGPWMHGGWARERGQQTVNHIYFGDSISTYYQEQIELPFFQHNLKGKTHEFPEAHVFDTGTKEWKQFDQWPPKQAKTSTFTFGNNGELMLNSKPKDNLVFPYFSDPNKPVPYRSEEEGLTFTPRLFITDDQRQASRRPDVLTFETNILEEDMTIAGEILADLMVSMTGTDADFIVKLIDVYPKDHENYEHNPENVRMGGYQQLVRHEVFRGRFRDSYENPQPFETDKPTQVKFPLQDILHTFKKGHKVMIQIHSTWFPYIDRNPQKYVPNIYKAEDSDFMPATIRIHGSSQIKVGGDVVE